jgi:hypothetical protein
MSRNAEIEILRRAETARRRAVGTGAFAGFVRLLDAREVKTVDHLVRVGYLDYTRSPCSGWRITPKGRAVLDEAEAHGSV